MVFIPAPGVAQAVIVHTLGGQQVNNVLHWSIGASISAANMTTLANSINESWIGSIMPQLSNTITLNEVRVRDLGVADGVQVAVSPAALVAGGIGGDVLPNSVAYCLTHRTALIGRSRRGRTYISGIPENVSTGNNVSVAFRTAIVAGFNQVKADAGVGGWVFGVLSRYVNKVARPSGIFTAVTLTVARDLRLDSQRGRMPD